jgi:hypothetical protein
MLACANTSFVVSVEQISYMVIANNNTYMINQNMKSYFVDFCHPKSMSFFTMVEHNLSNMTSSKKFVIIVTCD